MGRIDKENYYLDIAETVAERSTCLRRCYGAIIVRNDEIIATGYNGAPRGRKNCEMCIRDRARPDRPDRLAFPVTPAAGAGWWAGSRPPAPNPPHGPHCTRPWYPE